MNFVYELPFGKGKHLRVDLSGVANHILGGWQFQWDITASSGSKPIEREIGPHAPERHRSPSGARSSPSGNDRICLGRSGTWTIPLHDRCV
jgi:hypothetical protein